MSRPGPLPAHGQPGLDNRDLAVVGGVLAMAVVAIVAARRRPSRLERWRRRMVRVLES